MPMEKERYCTLNGPCVMVETKAAIPVKEPEIIRCKDCKYHHHDNTGTPYCSLIDPGLGLEDDDFCIRAERREEG